MFSRFTVGLSLIALSLGNGQLAAESLKLNDLQSEYGALQGRMDLKAQTVLLFERAKVKVIRQTGEAKIETLPEEPDSSFVSDPSFSGSFAILKRKIARLPAHEQVRYWKLHEIRYPESDVSAELEAAMDLMEQVRQDSLVKRDEAVADEKESVGQTNRHRGRTSFLPDFPSYGYSSNYRYRRALREDTQIELDRMARKPKPVEAWTTPMSLADRARSEAYGLTAGVR